MCTVNAPRYSKQQRKGVVSNSFIQHARGVGDHNPLCRGGVHINAIIADAPSGNNLEFRCLRAGQKFGRVLIHPRINSLYSSEQWL